MPSQGSIGERVRGLRLSRRLSQKELAGEDLSDSYVSLIESGKRTPTPTVVRILAARLDCSTDYLLQGVEPRQQLDTELDLRYALLELYHGERESAMRRLQDLAESKTEDNPPLAATAAIGLARAKEMAGSIEEAIEDYERLRVTAVQHPELIALLPITAALCRCYARAGDLIRAIELATDALEQVDALGVDRGEDAIETAEALSWLDGGHGTDFTDRVLSAASHGPVPHLEEITILWAISRSVASAGQPVIAVRLADDALRASLQIRTAGALARIRLAHAAHALDSVAGPADIERAEELIAAAVRHLSGDEQAGMGHILTARAKVLAGAPKSALEATDQALALLEGEPGVSLAQAWTVKAEAHSIAGERDAANAALSAAAAVLTKLPPSRDVAKVWRSIGDLHAELGGDELMASAYRNALRAVGLRSPTAVMFRESVKS